MSTDCPILVWMLSLNREYSEEEYNACFNLVKECVQHVSFQHNPPDPDSFRECLMHPPPQRSVDQLTCPR
jgi:4'-phosphopantetheinyl transferase